MPNRHLIQFLGLEVSIADVPRDLEDPWRGTEVIVSVRNGNGGFAIQNSSLKADAVAAQFAKAVIVTRHLALIQHLRSLPGGAEFDVIAHAEPEDVKGRVVVGVLPLRLAALALIAVEAPLHIPPELRGIELDLARVKQYAGAPRLYCVSLA